MLEEISTITAKGQTTVPKSVRTALGVDYGGKIAFRVDERGVSVHRAETDNEDPAIDRFLAFLADDIARRPEAVTALSPALAERLAALTHGVKVDHNAPIDGDVDL
jgi:antitoxin PrlF